MANPVNSNRWAGRVAIVTGASAGIGAAICRRFVRLGIKVVGVARNSERIQKIAKELSGAPGSLTAIKCDLSKDVQVEAMFKQVIDKFGAVHLLVNCAAYSNSSGLLEGTTSEWRGMLDVNVVAVCLLTKLSVQSMREHGIDDGQIINISSLLGHLVASSLPFLHFYTATKFAVRALTEGLRQELRAAKSHIRVSDISPGIVETEFAERMLGKEQADKLHAMFKCLQPDDIAAIAENVILKPPHVEINDVIVRPVEEEI